MFMNILSEWSIKTFMFKEDILTNNAYLSLCDALKSIDPKSLNTKQQTKASKNDRI